MGNLGPLELFVFGLIVAGVVVLVSRRGRPTDLVKCRACGKLVSPRAKKCPYCGEPRTIVRG